MVAYGSENYTIDIECIDQDEEWDGAEGDGSEGDDPGNA